jgi:hypothetical protein
MFLIAPLVYLLVALQQSAGATENAQETAENRKLAQEAEEREWQRKMELADKRLKHEEKLARIQAKATIPTPQKIAENADTAQPVALYECACGQVYEKPQSYSAHTRHCEIHQRVSANGVAK